jgi:Ser/Thr protein kinase RdoA (MazF antagonist)
VTEDTPYAGLDPARVLDALSALGFACDGRLLALNSFENRVYQIGLDDGQFVVAKFYRPGRWHDAQIEEEHAFMRELVEAEIPVLAPLTRDGQSLFRHRGYRFAVFPRRGGRAPELEGTSVAQWLGRTLGRLHLIGARRTFAERETITMASMVDAPARAVLASTLLPEHLRERYARAIERARSLLAAHWQAAAAPRRPLRLHGDCHPGNVLWSDAGPLLVDFDDARNGPAIQDLWMLMTGEPAQRDALLEGYAQFRHFDAGELALIEPLRLMRQIHYAGWIAARWTDPAFPLAFPWAAQARYWEGHVQDIHDAATSLAQD